MFPKVAPQAYVAGFLQQTCVSVTASLFRWQITLNGLMNKLTNELITTRAGPGEAARSGGSAEVEWMVADCLLIQDALHVPPTLSFPAHKSVHWQLHKQARGK